MVEVVIALGIVAFSLMAIFSLLTVSFDADKAAKDDTVLAAITRGTIGGLRSQPFESALVFANGKPTLYFDVTGAPAASAAQGVYQCTVSAVSDPGTAGPAGPNLLRVKLDFRWPVGASGGNQRIVRASLARYE